VASSRACTTLTFAHFGMLTRGNCWLTVGGMPEALPLAGGDCILLQIQHSSDLHALKEISNRVHGKPPLWTIRQVIWTERQFKSSEMDI
jgi:hypothetical protein